MHKRYPPALGISSLRASPPLLGPVDFPVRTTRPTRELSKSVGPRTAPHVRWRVGVSRRAISCRSPKPRTASAAVRFWCAHGQWAHRGTGYAADPSIAAMDAAIAVIISGISRRDVDIACRMPWHPRVYPCCRPSNGVPSPDSEFIQAGWIRDGPQARRSHVSKPGMVLHRLSMVWPDPDECVLRRIGACDGHRRESLSRTTREKSPREPPEQSAGPKSVCVRFLR